MRQDRAEWLALVALGWLAADAGRLAAFLAATGAAPSDLRARAGEAAFLGGVLDFVLAEDARVLAVAAEAGVPPGEVAAARAALPGGGTPHWT